MGNQAGDPLWWISGVRQMVKKNREKQGCGQSIGQQKRKNLGLLWKEPGRRDEIKDVQRQD